MKFVTILALCLFIVSISAIAFADEPVQVKQPEKSLEAEAMEEGQIIREAKGLPSTLMTGDEERSSTMQQVEELREGYVYDEEMQDD